MLCITSVVVVVVLCSDVFLMFLPYWKPGGIWLFNSVLNVVVVLCSDFFLVFLPYWKPGGIWLLLLPYWEPDGIWLLFLPYWEPDGIWLLFETRVRETQSHTWAGCHLQHVLPNRRSSLCSSQNVGGCSLEVWVHCRMVWGRLLHHSCSLEDGPSWFLCLSHSWFRSCLIDDHLFCLGRRVRHLSSPRSDERHVSR